MNSATDLATGLLTMIAIAVFTAAVVSRLLSGRFLVPKREIILPNQQGVVVQGDQVVRVAGPGTCWVRPRQRLMLVDMRPKPVQLAGFEVLGSDNRVVRLSMSGEYKVADPSLFYSNSANAADALYVQLRRVINVAARQQPGSSVSSGTQAFTGRVLHDIHAPAERLGLEMVQLDLYEAVPLGYVAMPEEPAFKFPDTGLVH